jgi:hypothetical protein
MNRRTFLAALAAPIAAPLALWAFPPAPAESEGWLVVRGRDGRPIRFLRSRKLPPRLVTQAELNRAFRKMQPRRFDA